MDDTEKLKEEQKKELTELLEGAANGDPVPAGAGAVGFAGLIPASLWAMVASRLVDMIEEMARKLIAEHLKDK